MPGRILQEDVDLVRERSPVADVIGDYVDLRHAGGGSLKGLCPFHDERTPSFTVTPGRGLYFCHGCHEGGDVIRFVMRIEGLPFAAATEQLAARAGIQLRYEQDTRPRSRQAGQRQRLAEANQAAARFYAAQMNRPAGEPAREYLAGLGAAETDSERAGAGWAPEAGGLAAHLAALGFSAGELLRAGLARPTGTGEVADAFTGRLMWPVRDTAGQVTGFGAQDIAGGGYLWTADSAVFRRDRMLYGADLARRETSRRRLAVVAATPADVLACRAAGIPGAVAACGTPLGEEHARALRDLIGDPAGPPGEVTLILPGPGLEAAAARMLPLEGTLGAPLYAVTLPDGVTVAGLRAARGDAAVRGLVARRAPLADVAVRAVLSRHDLGTPAGREAAAGVAARLIARVPDRAAWPLHAAALAARPGFPGRDRILDQARQAAGDGERDRDPYPGAAAEREVLRLAVQRPWLAGPEFDALPPDAFTVPAHAGVLELIRSLGGTAAAGGGWPGALLAAAPDGQARDLVTGLATEPLRSPGEPDGQYADMLLARLRERHAARETAAAMARLQRTSPAADPAAYRRMIGRLMELGRQREWLAGRAAPRARPPARPPGQAAPRPGR